MNDFIRKVCYIRCDMPEFKSGRYKIKRTETTVCLLKNHHRKGGKARGGALERGGGGRGYTQKVLLNNFMYNKCTIIKCICYETMLHNSLKVLILHNFKSLGKDFCVCNIPTS